MTAIYQTLEKKLKDGRTILLDGGTGTDIQSRGAPMNSEVWCAEANLTHPQIVQAVHADYIRAGAEIVTANTFATSPLLFDHVGRSGELGKIDHIAVGLARAAREEAGEGRPIAVAGSFSVMRPVTAHSDRQILVEWPEAKARELMRRKADALASAGVDLIIMEMMRDTDYSVWATEAAVATGLPVWVGISAETAKASGELTGFGRPDQRFADIVGPLMASGGKVCLVMHSSLNDTDRALPILKERWPGPFGVYPESGYFKMPDWQFGDLDPEGFVSACRSWRQAGASVLGGCCGVGPEHIRALGEALSSSEL